MLFILFLALAVPRLLGIQPYIVLSGSMEPSVSTGSLVFVNTKAVRPSPGDIITYRLQDNLVTHRIIQDLGAAWITKGDANPSPDISPVKKSQLTGTLFFSIPYLGFFAAEIKKTNAELVFLTLFLLLLHFFHTHHAFSPKRT